MIAAGGISDPAQVAAAIDAGAVAVMVGTVLLLAPEAGTSAAYRAALTGPDRGDTDRHKSVHRTAGPRAAQPIHRRARRARTGRLSRAAPPDQPDPQGRCSRRRTPRTSTSGPARATAPRAHNRSGRLCASSPATSDQSSVLISSPIARIVCSTARRVAASSSGQLHKTAYDTTALRGRDHPDVGPHAVVRPRLVPQPQPEIVDVVCERIEVERAGHHRQVGVVREPVQDGERSAYSRCMMSTQSCAQPTLTVGGTPAGRVIRT